MSSRAAVLKVGSASHGQGVREFFFYKSFICYEFFLYILVIIKLIDGDHFRQPMHYNMNIMSPGCPMFGLISTFILTHHVNLPGCLKSLLSTSCIRQFAASLRTRSSESQKR